jgi:hypothetical protein
LANHKRDNRHQERRVIRIKRIKEREQRIVRPGTTERSSSSPSFTF